MGATGPKDPLLTNAGGLLMAAGFIAAFTGGMFGLTRNDPTLVVLSVLLLVGYGIVGYLLRTRGEDHVAFVLPASAILVLLTLFILRGDAGDLFSLGGGGDQLLYPALTLILAFAGGALVTYALEQRLERAAWPNKGAPSLNPLLHIAAYAPVWNAFTLLGMMNAPAAGARVALVGASVAVSIACVVGGYASARHMHPRVTLAGASIGFLASVFYLFQFMLGGGDRGPAFFGEFNALLGLILTGLPIAISTVAWVQLTAERDAPPQPPLAEAME